MTKKQIENALKQEQNTNYELRKHIVELKTKLDIATSALTSIVNKLK